ncbi:MAG TPA: hypothetical protein PKN20_00150 [Verrucomicrobiota bacterium]|jgi:hypothetical protein|nr:hypothetical protein [Verrucomicrobiota bacterium]
MKGNYMSEHISKTIEEMVAKVEEHEAAAVEAKRLVNQLCAFAKLPVRYSDADLQTSGVASLVVKRNSFFGRPLTTVVREYLEMRQKAGMGPASLTDIYAALKEGGFDLDELSRKSDGEQRRIVAVSLGKNSLTFVRLPTDDWGLKEWYPKLKNKKENGKSNGDADAAGAAGEEPEAAAAGVATVDLPLSASAEEPEKAEQAS